MCKSLIPRWTRSVRVKYLFVGIITAGLALAVNAAAIDKNGFGYDPPKLLPTAKLTLWATYYYVHEAKYDPNGVALNDADGRPTGVKLSSCDWCDAAVEGTIRTFDKDGNDVTLNYAKTGEVLQCDCGAACKKYANYGNKKVGYTLWAPALGEFGDGVSGYKLVPFRTIAVDRSVIPIGSLIFIPQAVGVEITLPDGSKSKHDGYFFAADVGGDIKADHIDVFFGLKTTNPFDFVRSSSDGKFDAFVISGNKVASAIAKLHK